MIGLRIGLVGSVVMLGGVAAVQAAPPDGAAVFGENCAACHQPHGEGIEGAFPKLAGNVFVQGPADLVARTVLKGRGGMPSFSSDLTDEQIADVTVYLQSINDRVAASTPR